MGMPKRIVEEFNNMNYICIKLFIYPHKQNEYITTINSTTQPFKGNLLVKGRRKIGYCSSVLVLHVHQPAVKHLGPTCSKEEIRGRWFECIGTR